MSRNDVVPRSRLPALAMVVALIALTVAVSTIVLSRDDEAALSDMLIGAIPTTIIAIASIAISTAALTRDVRPRWVAVTAFLISWVLALFFGPPLLIALL
ncbi:hypothetical protein [Leifsonia shinshuensis]|uniref:Uncharacterized protein n=1 Tax=Leifsonia shinshuensis TaxID=150026 RepID=A0A853CTN9_9MICO|nr:hypothetical protein [Leifsonia shinshuensis]NYJ23283.1 hypothetical protein [Leifsonia shinshuensis]